MPTRCRLVLVLFTLGSHGPALAGAGEFAQIPPAPGMALVPLEPGMAHGEIGDPFAKATGSLSPQTDIAVGQRRLRVLGGGFPTAAGRLPNQRTGARHQHAVHDICIGC